MVLFAWGWAQAAAPGQANTVIRIDASQPWTEPQAAAYDGGTSTSPAAGVLGLNSRYLTLDGKPWLPVMGEFHFSRYPQSDWEEEILKMKAAGVNIVSAYVIWIHHEEIEGQFDWEGQRNLRAFAEVCAKHHMYLIARIGPWDHGEVRNGGIPDWVLKKGPTRVNDPVYLASVRAWYGQIGRQLKGLLWKDGGPVIGIQLENEYSMRGPNAGQAHILELKKIARASGLDVPLYFVTGWDNAVVPARAVIPLYGGYPGAPWSRGLAKLPPAEVYAFRFKSRVAANDSAAGAPDAPGAQRGATRRMPYLTAELGGGNEDTYHRRPVIAAADIAAMFPVMLGSGVNLYGTYMFQGGENPDGKLSTLQESQQTGYPNDVPIKSYDFQAPLGEFGQERESLRKMKVFQYFLNDFGAELAPMMVHAPATLPRDIRDLSTPRAAVRSRGDSGFIFFNNYVRGYTMPARRGVQFAVRLPAAQGKADGTLLVPRHPVDVPSGAYFIWPFNQRLGGITLRYSTAQLFTRVESAGAGTYYFEALPGIAPEFAFDAATIRSVRASSGEIRRDAGLFYADGVKPGLASSIEAVTNKGRTVRLVLLTADEAEHAWKVRLGGRERLLITNQEIVADPDAGCGRVRLLARGTTQFKFAMTPPPAAALQASLPLTETEQTPQLASFSADARARDVKLECRPTQAAGLAPPVKIGEPHSWGPHGVAEAPAAGELPGSAKWAISIPAGSMNGLHELFLEVAYQGDVARFSARGRLLTDDFYNGRPWTIGLKRFLDAQGGGSFQLSILPLRKDAPVYFELAHTPDFAGNGQVGRIDSIHLVPEYQLDIDAGCR